ncbi:FG-GAP repeat protein [Saccharospirillum sp. HFRX-1]|uniref:FG-GAP repeat protein n=1 Tax=unclassified Saccharospirillum TaxID=2633430 RepID=UPI003714AD5B
MVLIVAMGKAVPEPFTAIGLSTDNWTDESYIKASNTDASDFFGTSLSLSGDGNTLAVGAPGEDSSATGINGDQAPEKKASASGAVYLY